MKFHITTTKYEIRFECEMLFYGIHQIVNSADGYPSHHVAVMLENFPGMKNISVELISKETKAPEGSNSFTSKF